MNAAPSASTDLMAFDVYTEAGNVWQWFRVVAPSHLRAIEIAEAGSNDPVHLVEVEAFTGAKVTERFIATSCECSGEVCDDKEEACEFADIDFKV